MPKEAILTEKQLKIFFNFFQDFINERINERLEEALKNKNRFLKFLILKFGRKVKKDDIVIALLKISSRIKSEYISFETIIQDKAISEFVIYLYENEPDLLRPTYFEIENAKRDFLKNNHPIENLTLAKEP